MSDWQPVYHRDSWDELEWKDLTQSQFIEVVKILVAHTGSGIFIHRYDKTIALIKGHEWNKDERGMSDG